MRSHLIKECGELQRKSKEAHSVRESMLRKRKKERKSYTFLSKYLEKQICLTGLYLHKWLYQEKYIISKKKSTLCHLKDSYFSQALGESIFQELVP